MTLVRGAGRRWFVGNSRWRVGAPANGRVGREWGLGIRIDKIECMSQLFVLFCPQMEGMKIGMDVAWLVASVLETRFV